MAEETQATTAAAREVTEEVVVVEKPVTEAAEKEEKLTPAAEELAEVVETVVEEEKDKTKDETTNTATTTTTDDAGQITQSVSFKEESNVASELPESQKKALDEFKKLIQDALEKHEFTAPPKKVEEKVAAAEEKKEEAGETSEAAKPEEEPKIEEVTEAEEEPPKEEEKAPEAEVEAAAAEPVEVKEEDEKAEVVAVVDEDGAKTVEAIEETVVSVSAPAEAEQTGDEPPKPAEDEVAAVEEPPKEPEAAPLPPEEVSIWGIPLLADERSDVILLKFLRARDFKVKEAFTMIKNTVAWRKEFGIDALLEEDLGNELDKVVYTSGFDKEGHPVCYNAFGEFMNKEFYQKTFSDEEKRTKFLKWRIQFLEKSIRTLDFSPTGINTIVQVNDLKNFPGPAKRGLRQATNQALQLLQDNYPEFVAKQVFINVPWWYLAFNKMISPFLTQRTKSKFVFAGPSKSAETLFKYITPEQVPVQYGGLRREGEQEFTTEDSATEITIKPASNHTIEIPVTEPSTLAWELRVVGWDVSYAAEFVPAAEGSYTVIVSKTRKVAATDEPIISDSFKVGEAGKVVLTIDNQSSKKKKLLYRSKTKPRTC